MRVESGKKVYNMGPGSKPVVYASVGDILDIETTDCYDGMAVSELDEENNIDSSRINPSTGPIYVSGAEIGDTLVVEVLGIKLGSRGIMRISPNFGVLKSHVLKSTFKMVKIDDGLIYFNEKCTLPVKPMIGVIGTCPCDRNYINECPGDHGGNMDTCDITIGSKVYLPVNVDGALLFIGDIHASMGDGESAGTGVEASGEVKIKLGVIKDTKLNRPYVETKDAFITICSSPTLEEASCMAVLDASNFISARLSIGFEDAYMLSSAACNLIISQIVNPLVTVRMEIPKYIFSGTK